MAYFLLCIVVEQSVVYRDIAWQHGSSRTGSRQNRFKVQFAVFSVSNGREVLFTQQQQFMASNRRTIFLGDNHSEGKWPNPP